MKNVFNTTFLLITGWLSFGNNVAKASPTPVTTFFAESNRDNIGKWELPSILKEVSGINYLGNNRFACIQDKEGVIFIYNTDVGKIEKQIPFSGPGDFEGIAIAGTSAFVVKSDGTIYDVQDFESAQPVVKQYNTPLTAKQNVEGLTFDKRNNRLLLAIKGTEPHNAKYKCVYAFDLNAKRLSAKPVVKIKLADSYFSSAIAKETNNTFQPTAIEIHPLTNDIYILQGAESKLLVLDEKGRVKKQYHFNRADFPQPEGLAFTPEGKLFISNEGTDSAATIVEVVL